LNNEISAKECDATGVAEWIKGLLQKIIYRMSKNAQTTNMFERLPFTLFTDRLRINPS